MLTLYLMRHGRTVENCQGRLQGQTDGHLDAEGRAQAARLRDQMAATPIDVLLSSDLARAMATARIVNEPHGLPIVPCPLLRERDWGELTGREARLVRALPALPPTVETEDACCRRAYRFLVDAYNRYDGRTVAAVTHGFFARCLRAVTTGVGLHNVPLMDNADCAVVKISNIAQLKLPAPTAPIISAN